jgi:hypothetical protein
MEIVCLNYFTDDASDPRNLRHIDEERMKEAENKTKDT